VDASRLRLRGSPHVDRSVSWPPRLGRARVRGFICHRLHLHCRSHKAPITYIRPSVDVRMYGTCMPYVRCTGHVRMYCTVRGSLEPVRTYILPSQIRAWTNKLRLISSRVFTFFPHGALVPKLASGLPEGTCSLGDRVWQLSHRNF
jgi:hypothetical protein